MASLPPTPAKNEKENEKERAGKLQNESLDTDTTKKNLNMCTIRNFVIFAHYTIFCKSIASCNINEFTDETLRDNIQWLEEAAASWRVDAQYDLARTYQMGNILPPNLERTMAWLNLSATAEHYQHEPAKIHLNYLTTHNPSINYQHEAAIIESAIQIYNKQVSELNRQEKLDLEPLFSKIFTQVLTEEAAKNNNPNIHYELSFRYGRGIGTEQNMNLSLKFLKSAAELGHTDAQVYLANRLSAENKGKYDYPDLARNDVEAFQWYEKAALQKSGWAECHVALCYLNGKGVPLDQKLGREMLLKSAEHYVLAQCELAKCYHEGILGFAQDAIQAVFWGKLAIQNIEQTSAEAQYLFGHFQEIGLPSKAAYNKASPDLFSACSLYNTAALGGNQDAQKALVRLRDTNPALILRFIDTYQLKADPGPITNANLELKVSEEHSFIERNVNPNTNWLALHLKKNSKKFQDIYSTPNSSAKNNSVANNPEVSKTSKAECLASGSAASATAAAPTASPKESIEEHKINSDYVHHTLTSLRKRIILMEYNLAWTSNWTSLNASHWLEEAAAIGNADAQLDLVNFYKTQHFMCSYPDRSYFWLMQAVQNGSIEAKDYFTNLKNKTSIFKNIKEDTVIPYALKLYGEVISDLKGKPLVRHLFSNCMLTALIKRATEENDAICQYELGGRYLLGIGCDKDPTSFYSWTKKSAGNNCYEAQLCLAQSLSSNPEIYHIFRNVILEKNDEEAFYWYQKAYLKQSYAPYYLAFHCFEGKGTKKDEQKGLAMVTKAAEQNVVEAQWELYRCYYQGIRGVPKNNFTAINWLVKAANNGSSNYQTGNAQYTLGYCYEKGSFAFKINLQLAYYWYNKAALKNDTAAQEALLNLQACHPRKIQAWAKLATVKSVQTPNKVTIVHDNETFCDNALENNPPPRDWLGERAARMGENKHNKKRNLFQDLLKKSEEKANATQEKDRHTPKNAQSLAGNVITHNAALNNSAANPNFAKTLQAKTLKPEILNPEEMALTLKIQEEKRIAEIKEKCNNLYAEFFTISIRFRELTGTKLSNLSQEVFSNNQIIMDLLTENNALLAPIEQNGLPGGKKNIQRQAKGALESNRKRKADVQELYNTFFKIYEGQANNPDSVQINLKQAITHFRDIFEKAQAELPQALKENNLNNIALWIESLHKYQATCEKTIAQLNAILTEMTAMVEALRKQHQDFNAQQSISTHIILTAAEEKLRNEKIKREALVLANIEADARKQQENQEREEATRKLREKRERWFAKGAEIQQEKMLVLAKIWEAKKAAKQALEKVKEEAKLNAIDEVLTKSTLLESEDETEDSSEESLDEDDFLQTKNDVLTRQPAVKPEIQKSPVKSPIKSPVKSLQQISPSQSTYQPLPKPTLPNLGKHITNQLEAIKVRSSIQRFLEDFRNLIQNEKQFTFREENRELEGYALLGKLCQLLEAMCEDKGPMGFLAKEVRNSLFHGDPKHVDPYYPKDNNTNNVNLKTNQNTKEAQKKDSVNERFVEMNLALLEINWNDPKIIEKVLLPEDFAKFAFYPRRLRTNDKLDLSQITVRDLYNRIQSLNKDKKENQELTHPVKQKDDKCKDDKNKELMTMAEGTKQKFARPNIKESEERYQFYQNKVKNLRSQENPNNIDVAKAAIGYLEGLMGNYAQYALEDPNYQGFLRNDAECPAIIIRGRDFRHNQVQLEVMYPSKNKKLTEDRTTDNTTLRKAPLPHANARAIALAYDSYADMPTLNIDANTSAVPNNVTLPVQVHKTNKTDLIKPLLRDKKKKIRQSIYNSNAHYNPNTQLPNPQLFTYPPTYSSISSTAAGAPNDLIMMPQVFYAVPVQPVYVPVLQPSTLLFSEPVTTQQPFMAHSTFVMQSAATTASAASAEQSQAQYPAQSQPQAQAQYNIASLGNSQATTSKSKIVISYYNNSIIHINYGTNADSARKFLNCMRSVEKELKIDLFPSKDNETIIEIHLSRVQFGGRKGFISQAQFEIEEISVNADAPNLYSNNIKNIL